MTLLEEENKPKAGMANFLGQTTGGLIGYNLFILLNDKEWLNRHIFYSTPLEVINKFIF